MQTQRVGPRALNQAKSQVKGSIMLGLESMSNRMMRLGKQELYHGKNVTMDRVIALVDEITADDVLDAAVRYLSEDTFSSITLRPEDRK